MFADLAPGLGHNLWVTALALLGCVLALWLLSIRLKDVSIIDIFWGPAFGVVAVLGWFLSEGHGVDERRALVTVLTTLWAVRLGLYLGWRNVGKGEDPRYTQCTMVPGAAERIRVHTDRDWLRKQVTY